MPTTRSRLAIVGSLSGLLAALIWAMIRAGFSMSVVPEDLVAAAAIWPRRTELWMTQFYADSPLYILVARVFGVESEIGLIRLALFVSTASLLGLALWAWRLTPVISRNRAARLAILAPVGGALFSGIGGYDAYTVLAWLIALMLWTLGSRVALVVGGAILGFQHFEQAVLGSAALILTWLALRDVLPNRLMRVSPLWLIPGAFLGKASLMLIFVWVGESLTGRTQWLDKYVVEWAKIGVSTFPYLLWALFAGFWLLVLLVWIRRGIQGRVLLMAAVTIGLIGTVMAGDRPRVFVLILLPSLMLGIVSYLNSLNDSKVERRTVEILAWLAPPILLAGKIAVNASYYDDAFVTLTWITGLGGPA